LRQLASKSHAATSLNARGKIAFTDIPSGNVSPGPETLNLERQRRSRRPDSLEGVNLGLREISDTDFIHGMGVDKNDLPVGSWMLAKSMV
jgi:hypothetical protein